MFWDYWISYTTHKYNSLPLVRFGPKPIKSKEEDCHDSLVMRLFRRRCHIFSYSFDVSLVTSPSIDKQSCDIISVQYLHSWATVFVLASVSLKEMFSCFRFVLFTFDCTKALCSSWVTAFNVFITHGLVKISSVREIITSSFLCDVSHKCSRMGWMSATVSNTVLNEPYNNINKKTNGHIDKKN